MPRYLVRTRNCSAMKKYRLDPTDFLTAGTKITSQHKGKADSVFTLKRDYPIPFLIPRPQNKYEEERLYGAAYEYLDYLYTSFLRRNKKAARKFHEFLKVAIEHFQSADTLHPQLLLPTKRSELKWPGFASPNRMIQKEQSGFVTELAQRAPLKSRGKQVSPDNMETIAAINLFGLIDRNRKHHGPCSWNGAEFVLPANLPRFNRKSFPLWKKAAEAIFTIEFGKDFELHPMFKEKYGKLIIGEKKKTRGVIRSRIKKAVFQALRGLAP